MVDAKLDRLNSIARNIFGETALQLAVREGHEAIVKRLCDDIWARDLRSLRDAIKYISNIRLRFFLQGQYDIYT